jgi:hypothetical protein
MPNAEQNYANHVQTVPGFLVLLIVLTLTIIGGLVNVYKSWGDHQRMYSATLVLTLSCCGLSGALYGRTFALRVQDRAIRAEENLRHFVLTGKLLDSRLDPKQIAALRFASDTEYVELAKKSAEQGTAPKDIKQAIRQWRADHYRA